MTRLYPQATPSRGVVVDIEGSRTLCVMTTPLGADVDPDVYCKKHGDEGEGVGSDTAPPLPVRHSNGSEMSSISRQPR